MELEQKRSAVKKLNERYTDLARAFGTDSAIVKDYEKTLRTVFGTDALRPAKTSAVNLKRRTAAKKQKGINFKEKKTAADMGLSLVSRDKKNLERVNDKELEALLRKQTAGQIKKDIKEEARKESEIQGRNITPDDILEAMDNVYEVMSDDSSEFYEAVKLYWEAVGGAGHALPPYTVLNDIIDGLKRADQALQNGDKELSHEIEAQLKERIKARSNELDYMEVFL